MFRSIRDFPRFSRLSYQRATMLAGALVTAAKLSDTLHGPERGAARASSVSSAALMLSGRPLGFIAILGVLALLGMISKNAVILIGQIDAERALGKTPRDAAVDASSSCFRPIMLTAVSTVLGMIPIAPTVF